MRNARCVATGDPPFFISSSTIKARCSPDHAMVYTENGTYTAVRRRAPHHCTPSPPEAMPLPNRGVLSAALCISSNCIVSVTNVRLLEWTAGNQHCTRIEGKSRLRSENICYRSFFIHNSRTWIAKTKIHKQQFDLLFYGAFEKLRKSCCYLLHVCPSVRMKQLCSYWTNLREILCVHIFRKSSEKIKFLLKSGKNNGFFTWRPVYITLHISLISS